MSLLLLFAYTPLAPSVPISELIQTAPLTGVGYAVQRPATSGEWRFGLELADPQAGDSIVWHDITRYYAGDSYQRGADEYLGKYRAAVAQVQLQTDNDDLAPWGQDTSDVFGVDVPLDAGLLMRLTMFRVVASVTVEWEPLWTGRVETWGDASAARGQIRTHVVTVTDTIADLANNLTTIEANAVPVSEWLTENLTDATWLFGVDFYGDDPADMAQDLTPTAAINRMDQASDPNGLVWRSRRDGRLIVYPAPWDTTNVARWSNPLLDVYPDGLVFSFSPDFTDIEYIADDEAQQFGIQRTALGVLNSYVVTIPSATVYADDNPLSIARYGVRPFVTTWIVNAVEQVVLDLLDSRAFASAQAQPLRTTLDHEGFWSALAIVDHLDPVTVIHATSDDGLVVTAPGTVRNVTEERTVRGEGSDGVMLLSWQSTVQVDITSTTAAPALLPVENLRVISMNSPLLGGPSSAEFAWDNPVQPSVTPTEVQLRVLGRSLIWFAESYPGVGADGTLIGFLSAATTYTLQVRLVRRENGVITAFSASRSVTFTTPAIILPTPTPGDDPGDSNVDMPPFEDCDDDVSLELQEQTEVGGVWTTVDTFDDAEIEQDDNGVWHLVTDIPNSFYNDGSMYRWLGFCGTQLIVTGLPFDPPDDWTDPCPSPATLSTAPFDDPSLLVYVPKVCTGFEDADPDYVFQGMLIVEAVSGIAGVPGDALASIGTTAGSYALEAIADPEWSDTPGGILAYGECPQVIGATGDKTMTVRVSVAEIEDCVLFECAGMRLLCTAVSGTTWRATVVVYKVGGTTITLPSTNLLALDTPYVITATSELATGDINLFIDGVADNSVGGSDNVATITALPIWRVGAPPESWITDCALFDAILVNPSDLELTLLSFGPTRYYTCEGNLPFPDLGSLNLDTVSASGSYTEGGEPGEDGRDYFDMTGTTDVRAGYDVIGSFKPNADQTLVILLKPDAVSGVGVRAIIEQGDGSNRRGLLYIDTNAKLIYAGGSNLAEVFYETASSGAVAGAWNLYTFRQQGATYEWRRNNADITGSSPTGGPAASALNAFRLGGSNYSGGIAHMATYNTFLSPANLTAIYNAAIADGWTI